MADYSDDWSDEDLRDATLYSLRRAADSFEEEEDEEAQCSPTPRVSPPPSCQD